MRALLLSSDPALEAALAAALRPTGDALATSVSPEEAQEALHGSLDWFVLDARTQPGGRALLKRVPATARSLAIGPAGALEGLLEAGANDVLDERWDEAALRQRWLVARRARASRGALLPQLLDNIPAFIAYINADQTYRYANAAYRRLGYDSEEILGRTVREVVGEAAYAVLAPHVERVLAGEPVAYETQATRGDLTLDLSGRYLPDVRPDGTVRGFYALIHDVTDLKRAAEERQALGAALAAAQKLESLGLLAAGVAHDFNNLLVSILGNVGLALQSAGEPPELDARLRAIETAAQRAAELTGQLLDYAGGHRRDLALVELGALVEEACRLLEPGLPPGARLLVDAPPTPLFIEGNATQLRRVVMNLLANAADSLGEGGGEIRARAERAAAPGAVEPGPPLDPGSYALLTIADTGCGMDEPTRARMFDPFFTTKFTGRGLGMAAALGIVRAHRGGLRVRSAPGAGTTIEVLLPLAAPQAAAHPARAAPRAGGLPRPGPDPAWPGAGLVLIADDEPGVRDVLGEILRQLGFAPIYAEDGREAVAAFAARAAEISLVLIDATMPHLSGAEALAQIRLLRPDVPCLLMSGYNDSLDADLAVPFLQKPARVAEIVAKLREVLGGAG